VNISTAVTVCAALVGTASLALVPNPALAQAFPTKPIRLIVPVTPGGGLDVFGRIIARVLSEGLGVQVVADNRGGASGRIGAEAVARAAPDGYTLLMGGVTPLSTIPSSDPKLSYDAVKDYAPISLVGTAEFNLVMHPSLPVRSVADFIALAKSKPGQIYCASTGIGSTSHFTWELFKQFAKIDIVHVPYRGGGFAYTALLGGEVSSFFGSASSITPHVKAGRLRPIASTGPKRSKTFPDIPTMSETVPGVVSTSWYGVLAPAGTPNDIIFRMHDIIVKGLNAPAIAQQIVASGADPISSSPEEFSAFIKAEIAKWTRVVKASGITVE
jgi:tripartite-type tricarboxylate transporter receptor subunit TctC